MPPNGVDAKYIPYIPKQEFASFRPWIDTAGTASGWPPS
jgi:hypothetical protein